MKRFIDWVKALFNRMMDKVEDPEMMLDQARRDMQGSLAANREKAVQAIAQKNRLQQMLDEAIKRSNQLEGQAAMALRQGNRELAKQFLREKATNDTTIESLKPTLAQAQEMVTQVRTAINRQNEEVRKKLAESLALKAQWKQSQINDSITKAMQGLTFENEYEGTFAAAREKIQSKQAEANARQEMFAGSIEGKVMQMEDLSMDYAADEELRKLEEKLGLAQPSAPQVQATATSDVDAELDALEKRLQQGQGSG
jgi:phage shock protein A